MSSDSAQKMADKIVKDAGDRADVITGAIKERCDAVIAEFKEQLKAEKEEMWELRSRIVDFKKELFDLYRGHIESIKSVSVNEIDEIVLPNEDALVARIFTDVKQGIQENADSDMGNTLDGLAEDKPMVTLPDEQPDEEAAQEAREAEDAFLRFMMEGDAR